MLVDRKKLELAMARACMNSADLPTATGLPRPTVQNAIVRRILGLAERLNRKEISVKYINVTPGSIPGVEIHDGAAFCKIAGEEYPVIAVIEDEKLGYLPVVDLPQMSDEQWDKLTREKKEAAQRADDTESGKVKKVSETAYFTTNDTTGMEGLQE